MLLAFSPIPPWILRIIFNFILIKDMMILKRKAIRSFIATLVTISCIISSLFIASAETAAATEGNIDLAIKTSKDTNSYSSYLSKYSKSEYSTKDAIYNLDGAVLEAEPIEFNINIENDGLYAIGMSYKALDKAMDDIIIGLKIDGEYLFANMEELAFPRMWCDSDGINADALGNEYVPEQVLYEDYYYYEAYDDALEVSEKFMVNLTAGEHKISIIPQKGKCEVEYFKFAATAAAQKYQAPKNDSEFYKGEPIVIEGEDAIIKTSYFLVGNSERGSLDVTPNNIEKRLINYIGNNWAQVGDTIVWETPKLEAGYYQLGFSFRQNAVIGAKSYRTLKIDGVSPFLEAENMGFKYGDNWQKSVYGYDADGNKKNGEETPYLIYLSEGTHKISMTVTASDMSIVRTKLTQAVAEMGDLYVDITKITGETVDIYRDYDLFRQISDMLPRLENIKALLEDSANTLLEITGETSGSNYSVIMNMLQTVNQMLNNKYDAHRYKSTYYTNYCSVSSVLMDLRSMPLVIDKMVLSAPNTEAFEKNTFFEKLAFSTKRFFWSFVDDYGQDTIVDDEAKDDNSLTIWVNWGRDQAQVLQALIERKFTPKTGIKVNLKLVNATIIQAVLSGKGPDCVLQHARTEPVNLAMRGVLYDLTKFDDYEQVLERFQEGADIPYWYKGGLYGLPDTQSFYVLFYRKDILEEFGIEVPKTWEEFDLATKLLMRNNMNVCMPSASNPNAALASGVTTAGLFPTLLMQNGLDLYTEDGSSTTMLGSASAEVFEKWTDYYTKLKVPKTMDFYNRFRTGTTPLGISTYNLYTTLKVAAPEIDGLWGMTKIPGTVREDGTISHASVGNGTACSILQMAADNGREDEAWEFLKWWTDDDTQLQYSNDVETILGPSGRVAVSNKNALANLTWDDGALEALEEARSSVTEIPEYPGSYYVQRSIYQAYWNIVENGKNTKDMMMKFGTEANNEIARKWKQYTNRG